jgi:quercetin dioxygenase-like cupin family protein
MQELFYIQDMREHRVTILLHGAVTQGQVALVQTVEVPGHEPPCHRHACEDKLIYVMAGTLAVYCNNVWRSAPAGAAVWIPRGTDHTFAVISGEALVLTLFVPAGFEGFYSEARAALPWSHTSASQLERLVATAARYGCDITGPHPGRPDVMGSAPEISRSALPGDQV